MLLFLAFGFQNQYAQAPSWGSAGLENENLINPTSLDFGPNEKLYVSQQDGLIWEFTIERDQAPAGEGSYTVTQANTITLIKNNTPNHQDDGNQNSTKKRQITGILATGTAANPILYVSSSDWRIGGKNEPGNDVNLDTNSGILSRLTWTGNAWEKVDLVRGLPRCEENHSNNGMELFTKNGKEYLLLQQGGNTNQGAPSNNFAGSSEYYLAGAILIIDLTQLQQIEDANGGPFTDLRDNNTKFIYDLPTINDPERQDITNAHPEFPYGPGHPLFNATIDIGDPFGGNNGLNQSFPEAGGPVQIFSPGYRNAYDIVITEQGDIYTFDNGPNGGWGGPPFIRTANGGVKGDHYNTTVNLAAGDYITNEFNYSNGVTHGDQLHYVGTINDPNNTYYAGHPVPIRAFPSKAQVIEYEYNGNDWVVSGKYDWENLIQGVSGYFQNNFTMNDFPDDGRQALYTTDDPGNPDLNILDIVNSSTNGMCVYTASNFNNQLKGNIFAASFNGNINRYELDVNTNQLTAKNNTYLSGFGSIPLDVIAQGDDEVFPGTIWAATYGADNITVFEPADFGICYQPGDAQFDPEADYDKDGFTNADEIANGSDHCSAGSKPSDADNDFISDLTDPDDDNDGIPDLQDNFALDPFNGTNTDLPVTYPFWNNDPGTGMFGLGFTGLMLDPTGQTNYLDMYDEENMSFGGAGGKATIDFTTSGDALETQNTQEYAFQFGVNIDENSEPFTVHGKIETPFNGVSPLEGQSYGIYVGKGDQDNYVKVALMNGTLPGDELDGIEILLESEGVVESQIINVPGLVDAIGVDLYLGIDPKTRTLDVAYSLDNGKSVSGIGNQTFLPADFFDPGDDQGLAVGIISTAGAAEEGYTATWDFLNVTEDQPGRITARPDAIDFGFLTVNSSPAEVILEVINLGGSDDPPVTITSINIINDPEGLFEVNSDLLYEIGSGVIQKIPVRINPGDAPGKKSADLQIIHDGINSPLNIPLTAELEQAKIEEPLVRINAGGTANFLATDGGPVWEANPENGMYTGDSYVVNTGNNFESEFDFELRDTASMPNYIDRPTFDAIFGAERYDLPDGEEMQYSIPLDNNTYLVRLYLGTNFQGTSSVGSRVFDILIEGQEVLNEFDPVAAFGFGSAGVVEFPITLQDGVLDISFNHIVENPNLYGIEILGYSFYNGIKARALAFPLEGPAPLETQFNGSSSSAVNNINSYLWNFDDGTTSDEINPLHTFTTPGTYNVTLTISDDANEDTDTLVVSVEEPLAPEDFSILINAGGEEATYNAKVFGKDAYYDSGREYVNKQAKVPNIYRSERNGSSNELNYEVALSNGNYEVSLHFAEIYFGATGGSASSEPGQRIFDVYIEDSLVLDNYDILAEVGSEATDVKTFNTVITDRKLNIRFDSGAQTGGVNYPKVSAIEIKGFNPNSKFLPLAIADIPDQFNDVGETPDLAINASGGDPEKNFTYGISGQPPGLDIEPTNGMIIGSIAEGARTGGPNNDGVYEVTVTVGKSLTDTLSTKFNWTIAEALNAWFDKDESENYTARHECSFVQAGDHFFLMGGRENAKSIDIYDYNSNTWTTLENNAPFEFNHFQAVSYQGLIWVIGAFNTNDFPNETPASNIWIFNPLTEEWKQGPEIPESRRRGSTGLVVHNDIFYILGGNNDGHDGGYVPYFDSFNPATGEWTVLADAPHARDHFHAVVAQNKLYAIGGRLSGGPGGVFAPTIPEVDVFDFSNNTWSTLSESRNLPTPRAGAVTVKFKNKIYVAGGEANNQEEAFKLTEIFDPLTQVWSQGDDLNHARHGTQGIASGNGIFVVGGSPRRGGGQQKNMEYYNYDNPSGIELNKSEIQLPEELIFSAGESIEVQALITGGNMAIFPDSLSVKGPNADLFQLEITGLPFLLSPNSTYAFNINYLGTGQYDSATLHVYYNGGQETTAALTTDHIPVMTDLLPVFRINTGGNLVNALDEGPDWLGDISNGAQQYEDFSVTTGNVFGGTELNYFDRHPSIPDYIDQDIFEKLFSTERYDTSSPPEMAYSIPLPNGNYTVHLYFGTSYEPTKDLDSRIFTISLEGQEVNPSFDVIRNFGFKVAGMLSYSTTVEDGVLDIAFGNVVQNPFINAIEVMVNAREINEDPLAVITSSATTGYTPLTINFSGTSSQDDFGIESYQWELGEGTTAEGAEVSKTYAEAGIYPVVLTVTDIYGLSDTDTTYIEVLRRPDPELTVSNDTLDFGTQIINGEIASLNLSLGNLPQTFNDRISIIAVTVMGENAAMFASDLESPQDIDTGALAEGEITFDPRTVIPGGKNALIQIVHSGENSPSEVMLRANVINDPELDPLYRINIGGATAVKASDDGPDWEKNPEDGFYKGTYYNLNGGTNSPGVLDYTQKGTSIPSYLNETTFNALYASQRSNSETGEAMNFELILPNGDYILNLFSSKSELLNHSPHLTIQGQVYSDILTQRSVQEDEALMMSFPVTVTNEQLLIDIQSNTGVFALNALEILSPSGIALEDLIAFEDGPGEKELNIFPNPSDGEVNFIYGNGGLELQKVLLFDMDGRMIRNIDPSAIPRTDALTNKDGSRIYTLELTGLSRGVYILVTEDENGDQKKAKLVIGSTQ
ncbi:PKD domain-containing protein [Robertkochia sp. 1368]|nr:PKD domain-containing protein [Robertkochia sediminum]